jgi:DNA replication protein DnaC
VCPDCGSDAGLAGNQANHRCCFCADGGRVRGADGMSRPCPRCAGGSANPEIREDPNKRMRIPWKYQDVTFASWLPDNGSERLKCQSFVASWPPAKPLLFLTGNRGTGKTTLAVAVLKRLYENERLAGQFWLAQRLLDRINATYDDEATETLQQIMQQLERVPLLVIDDFGSEKSTEAARSRFFTIIDSRYTNGRPLIVTSNATTQEVDQRVKSRLSDGAVSEIVNFKGRDMRPEAS